MTRVGISVVAFVVVVATALVSYFVLRFSAFAPAPVAGFDELVSRVDRAAAAGHVAEGLGSPVCQASNPNHLGNLARGFLHGQPAVECVSDLQPAEALAKPVIVIDFDSKQIDAIQATLPESLRAHSLNTAATIALIRCSKRKTGSYGFFRDAYARECNVLFVAPDGPTGARILGLAFFRVAPPEKIYTRFTVSGDIVGDRPDFDMRYYIVSRFARAAEPETPSATR